MLLKGGSELCRFIRKLNWIGKLLSMFKYRSVLTKHFYSVQWIYYKPVFNHISIIACIDKLKTEGSLLLKTESIF